MTAATAAVLVAAWTGAWMATTDDAQETGGGARPVHARRSLDTPCVAAPELEGRPLAFDGRFDEALLSWNVDVADDDGFVVEVRVGRRDEPDSWSPWLEIGSWGRTRPVRPAQEFTTSFASGRVDVDVFRSDERWDRLQWRVTAARRAVVRRLDVTVTDRSGAEAGRLGPPPAPFEPPAAPFRLDVPFRSQHDEADAIARRICSPTSVAMVLEYHGEARPTAEVAARLLDPDHDLYGNWARAVQGAWTYGVPGRLTRYTDWNEVRETLAAGRPLVVSIGVAEGELAGAPYTRTNGHLVVLCGFDAAGDVHVNDPAARDAAAGRTVYRRVELDHVWLRRGGTAYVFDAPG